TQNLQKNIYYIQFFNKMIQHMPYFLKQTQKKPIQNRTRTTVPTFLLKTYEMLENQNYQDIVCWNEDGKSFLIRKQNAFRDQLLPQYFKHNNYASFVRQLNMYDFHKVRNESGDSEYKNDLFQKGKNLVNQQQEILGNFKQDYNNFLNDMLNFKNKQHDLDIAMKMLIQQHEQLLRENKMLWEELRKQ
ncbi:hypothetical protein IMG5_142700, partial [Ichthyophthirius multifiliis]